MLKRIAVLLCASLCLLAGACAEETLTALRQETADGWHETYTTTQGQTIQIDAPILVPDEGEWVSGYQVQKSPPIEGELLAGYRVRTILADSVSLSLPLDQQEEENLSRQLGAFQGSRRYGRAVPQLRALSYQEACRTAEGIVNTLFDRTLTDYVLSSGEVADWENGQTYLLCFVPKQNGLPVNCDSVTLDIRSANYWYAHVSFHSYQETETHLALVPFAQVRQEVLAAIESGKAYENQGLGDLGPMEAITQVQLEYALFSQKGKKLLLPVWTVDFETTGHEETGENVGRLSFSAQTGKQLIWNGTGYRIP